MFRKSLKHKKRGSKKNLTKIYILAFLLLVLFLSSHLISLFNQRFLPIIIEIAQINAQANINRLMNDALADIVRELSLEATDFYTGSVDADGNIQSLSANTLLINDICARLAADLSEKLSTTEGQTVSVPIGSLLGIDILANTGPDYAIELLPRGHTTVDFETAFVSAGINQTNYQIWLTVDARVQIVNPMQETEIAVTRKIPLVNTVINGAVPPGIHTYDLVSPQ